MDQTRALNALEPFLALAKSAAAPRAAADLITQATSATNTYVFAELLQQPNIQALAGNEQYGSHFTLLQTFAYGTWESYKSDSNLPQLSDAQTTKLRLLSLLTIASAKPTSSSTETNLSYGSLCRALDLASPIDLEHLITQAIYNNLITATLNPANQAVVITSVAPLRDLSPGSVHAMVAELEAWSGRCDSVLAELEAEIALVKAKAAKRRAREKKAEKQIAAVTEASEKGGSSGGALGGPLSNSRSGHNTRGATKRDPQEDDEDDLMEVDSNGAGGLGGGGKKRSAGGGGIGGMFRGMTGGRTGR